MLARADPACLIPFGSPCSDLQAMKMMRSSFEEYSVYTMLRPAGNEDDALFLE